MQGRAEVALLPRQQSRPLSPLSPPTTGFIMSLSVFISPTIGFNSINMLSLNIYNDWNGSCKEAISWSANEEVNLQSFNQLQQLITSCPKHLRTCFLWKFVIISSKCVGDLAPSLTDTSPSGGHLVTNPLSQSLWGQAALSESPLFCLRKRKKIARKRYMQPRKNGTKYIAFKRGRSQNFLYERRRTQIIGTQETGISGQNLCGP